MELKSLSLSRNTWEEGKPIRGDITFASPIGEVKLTLTDKDCKDILRIISARLVEQTREVAQNMTAEIIENTGPLLTHEA